MAVAVVVAATVVVVVAGTVTDPQQCRTRAGPGSREHFSVTFVFLVLNPAVDVSAARPRFFQLTFVAEPGAVARAENGSQPIVLMKETPIEIEGIIHTVLPGTMFRVELDNKHVVLATICGKMRKRWVRLTAGDRVKMEMSPYDLDKARITWRLR